MIEPTVGRFRVEAVIPGIAGTDDVIIVDPNKRGIIVNGWVSWSKYPTLMAHRDRLRSLDPPSVSHGGGINGGPGSSRSRGLFFVQILSKTATVNVDNRWKVSAGGGNRTHMGFLPRDFKSLASAIPPPRPAYCYTTTYARHATAENAGGASLRGENDVIHRTSRSSVSCVTTRSMVSSSGHWYAFLSASRLSHPPACATSTSGKLFRELAQSRR